MASGVIYQNPKVRPILFPNLLQVLFVLMSEEYNNREISRITYANFFRNSRT